MENTPIMIRHKIYKYFRSKFRYLPESLLQIAEGIVQCKLRSKYYSAKLPDSKKTAICMIDGVVNHGGLTDRLQGILSTYYICEQLGINFKIYFISPFNLNDYLVPNEVQWQISVADIYYDNQTSTPIYIRNIKGKQERKRYEKFRERLRNSQMSQLHVYSNLKCFPDNYYSYLFGRLFKPSEALKHEIDFHLNKIKKQYISLTFRFQQLLGDFKEGDFKTLSLEERNHLIKACISIVENLYIENMGMYSCILVTSDSSTFLKEILHLPYIYIIPGEVVHMAYTFNSAFDVYLKSFLDLYMIANASEIYSVKIGPMYDSGFPRFASKIYGRPFHLIAKTSI